VGSEANAEAFFFTEGNRRAGVANPTMSVIVVTETYSECLRWTLECLSAQSIASELECILSHAPAAD